MSYMIKKKMIMDMVLNVSAAAIPLAILQLVAYPVLSRHITENEYGLMITMYSLWLLISNTLGNVIFNVRLIKNNEYEDKHLRGDFLIIFLQYAVFNIICIAIITLYFNHGFSALHFLLSLVIASVLFIKAYVDVGFRLIIDYRSVTISGFIVGGGFLLGTIIAIETGIWEIIFIIGYSAGCLYTIAKSKLLSEGLKKTSMYHETRTDCLKLTAASIISHIMTYADKLVLFPLMGGKVIAIYYNATLLAKIVGMVTGPSSGVILTYLSKDKNSNQQSFNRMLIIGICVVTAGYFLVILFARPIMGLLYPQWVNEIMRYIPITTINVSILALISILNPFVLKFCDLKWQIVISGGGVAVYFFAALILWHFQGLMGFCVGTVIGSLTRLILILYVHKYKLEERC